MSYFFSFKGKCESHRKGVIETKRERNIDMYKEKGRGKGGEIQEKRIKTRRKKEKEIYILNKKEGKGKEGENTTR